MMLRWISLVPPAIVYCRAPSTRWNQRDAQQYTIADGTSEIQRNIIGERVLGLLKG